MRALLPLIAVAMCTPSHAGDTPEVAAAVAALEKLGAKVSRHEDTPGKPVRQVHFPRKGCDITDDDLKHLAALPDLEWALILGQKKVTGEGLKHLTKLSKLRHIDFSKTPITSASLAHLSGMKQLIRLGLWDTAIDDEGLAHLRQLNALEHLFLNGTKVGDKGLEALGPKPRLWDLQYSDNQFSEKGKALMKKLFPPNGVELDK